MSDHVSVQLIDSADLADKAVANPKVNDGAIDSQAIKDQSIELSDIVTDAVNTLPMED